MLADALIRSNQWEDAKAELNTIPPTHETFDRYRLEAMVADSEKNWKKADSFYEIASGLTTKPAGVLNNWGYSKLTRGEHAGAEKLFTEALTYDPGMFTAKNNLVLARAAQRKYDLPVVRHDPVRTGRTAVHDGAGRDQAGRCLGRQGPVAGSHRHPSAAFRGRRAQPCRAGRERGDSDDHLSTLVRWSFWSLRPAHRDLGQRGPT
jgi:hypothetical protein